MRQLQGARTAGAIDDDVRWMVSAEPVEAFRFRLSTNGRARSLARLFEVEIDWNEAPIWDMRPVLKPY
jgi:hypothetical protein